MDQPNENPNYLEIISYLVYGFENNDLKEVFSRKHFSEKYLKFQWKCFVGKVNLVLRIV